MTEHQQVTLKEDVFSHFRKNRTGNSMYGSKNEKVKLIATRGNVAILENAKGFRFPAPIDKLKENVRMDR